MTSHRTPKMTRDALWSAATCRRFVLQRLQFATARSVGWRFTGAKESGDKSPHSKDDMRPPFGVRRLVAAFFLQRSDSPLTRSVGWRFTRGKRKR